MSSNKSAGTGGQLARTAFRNARSRGTFGVWRLSDKRQNRTSDSACPRIFRRTEDMFLCLCRGRTCIEQRRRRVYRARTRCMVWFLRIADRASTRTEFRKGLAGAFMLGYLPGKVLPSYDGAVNVLRADLDGVAGAAGHISAAMMVVPVPQNGSITRCPGRECVSSPRVASDTAMPAPCTLLPMSTP